MPQIERKQFPSLIYNFGNLDTFIKLNKMLHSPSLHYRVQFALVFCTNVKPVEKIFVDERQDSEVSILLQASTSFTSSGGGGAYGGAYGSSPPARGSSRSGFYSNILANVRCFLPIASRWGNLRALLESVFKRSTKLVYVGISQNLPAKSA